MERDEQQWIEKAISSLDGIQPAAPPANMHTKIMQRIQAERFSILPDRVPQATVYRAAAAILVIIAMNVFTCVAFSKNVTKQKQLQNIAKEYSLLDAGDGFLNM